MTGPQSAGDALQKKLAEWGNRGPQQQIEGEAQPEERYEQKGAEKVAEAPPTTGSIRTPPKGDEQGDLLVPSLYDVGTRDSRTVMDVAVFRLSKRDRRAGKTITYDLPDGTVTVSSGAAGMASIWDYDLVLMAISHVTEAMNRYKDGRGEKPGRVFRPHVAEILKFLRRADGGKQKADLIGTCKRLNTTHVAIERTKKSRNGHTYVVSEGEGLISNYRVVKNATTDAIESLEIELAKWMYEEVTEGKKPDVLTVHPDYFLISPGIARFVYRLARRAAGRTLAKWSFKTIYERSGSTSTQKKFNENLRKVIEANDIPEYELIEEPGQSGPQLIMTHRQHLARLAALEAGDEEG